MGKELMLKLPKLISFNLGGHFNHSFFWNNLSPINKNGGVLPDSNSKFSNLVNSNFGSYENLMEKFVNKSVAIQGSGWGWLAYDNNNNNLVITETSNQDTLSQIGLTPLLTVDVWEHAYYVNYHNLRLKYLNEIWQIIDWKEV